MIVKNNSTKNIPWYLEFDEDNYELVDKTPRNPIEGEMFCMLADVIRNEDEPDKIEQVMCEDIDVYYEDRDNLSDNEHLGRKRFIIRKKPDVHDNHG